MKSIRSIFLVAQHVLAEPKNLAFKRVLNSMKGGFVPVSKRIGNQHQFFDRQSVGSMVAAVAHLMGMTT
ncbi:MAG: hypothetical protein HQ472_06540 [Ignavibacteria bacterium]|nr:hypothetical protein [Ignavibacteria bacterium]